MLHSRFRKDYLALLIQRGREPRSSPVQIGHIALIEDEHHRRLDWRLGKVTKVFKGRDGISRITRLKTAGGELVRPFQLLYPLEITAQTGQELILAKGETILEIDTSTVLPEREPTVRDKVTHHSRRIQAPVKLNFVINSIFLDHHSILC